MIVVALTFALALALVTATAAASAAASHLLLLFINQTKENVGTFLPPTTISYYFSFPFGPFRSEEDAPSLSPLLLSSGGGGSSSSSSSSSREGRSVRAEKAEKTEEEARLLSDALDAKLRISSSAAATGGVAARYGFDRRFSNFFAPLMNEYPTLSAVPGDPDRTPLAERQSK